MRLTRDLEIGNDMNTYIIPLLKKRQSGMCIRCGDELYDYQICHKRYGMDIGLDDLELAHGHCHALEHGRTGSCGPVRND